MAGQPIFHDDLVASESFIEILKTLRGEVEKTSKALDQTAKARAKVVQAASPSDPNGQKTIEKEANATTLLADRKKKLIQLNDDLAAQEKAAIQRHNKLISDKAKEINQAKELSEWAKKEAKSYDEMSKKMSILQAARKKLDLTTAEGKKQFEAYNKEISKLNDNLKKMDGAVGNSQRNVGNYKSAWQGLNNVWIKAAGIVGIVIGVLKTVGEVMQMTDSGALGLQARIAGVKGGFTALKDQLAEVLNGSRGVMDMFDGLADRMYNAGQAADAYTRAMDKINDTNAAFVAQEARMRNEIARLRFASVDQSSTPDKRAAALKEVLKLEAEIVDFKRTQAKAAYDAEIVQISKRFNISDKIIRAIIEQDKEWVENVVRNDARAAKAWDKLYGQGGPGPELSKMYANWIDLDTQYYEQNLRTQGKMTGFENKIENQTNKINEATKAWDAYVNEMKAAASIQQAMTTGEFTGPLPEAGMSGMTRIETGAVTIPGMQSGLVDPGNTSGGTTSGRSAEEQLFGEGGLSIQKAQAYASELQTILSEISSMIENHYQDELDAMNNRYDSEENRLDTLLRKRVITEDEYNKQKTELDKKREKDAIKLKKESAEKQKTIAYLQAIINIAQGITAALGLGPIGIALAAIIGIMGAIEIDTISSTKFARGGHGQIDKNKGGVLRGPRHDRGGVSLGELGEAEGGEYFGILNRQATEKYRDIMPAVFDSLNSMKFEKAFAPIIHVHNNDKIQKAMLGEMQKPNKTVTVADGYTIERMGNYVRKYRN